MFVLYLGPKWMKNRKPFDLKYVIILYNVLQVYHNYWMISTVSHDSWVVFGSLLIFFASHDYRPSVTKTSSNSSSVSVVLTSHLPNNLTSVTRFIAPFGTDPSTKSLTCSTPFSSSSAKNKVTSRFYMCIITLQWWRFVGPSRNITPDKNQQLLVFVILVFIW